MERVRGIEPPSSAWEAAALPLSYTRAAIAECHAVRQASMDSCPGGVCDNSRKDKLAYADLAGPIRFRGF
jgi:hypothetical protein